MITLLCIIALGVSWIGTGICCAGNASDNTKSAGWLISIGLTFVSLYIHRPWFHGLIQSLFQIYWFPFFLFVGLFIFMIGYWTTHSNPDGLISLIGVLALMASFIYLCMSGNWYYKVLYENTNYRIVDKLPQVTRPKYLPLAVARKYARSSFREPQEKIDSFSNVNKDGRLAWQAPRVPDGDWIYFSNKMGGTVEIDTTTTDKKIEIQSFTMEVSEGIGIFDNIRFTLYKDDFWMHIPDSIIYLQDPTTGKRVAIVPFVKYGFSFPCSHPKFGGVYIVYEDGSFTKVKPSQIKEHPILKDQVIYPCWLLREEVQAYRYKGGVWNKLAVHKDQIEIADVAAGQNPQPYLIMAGTPHWYIAAEPNGDAYGIFKTFAKDASQPDAPILIQETPQEAALTGPKEIIGFIKSNVEVPDWTSFDVIEPRPAPMEGRLFWLASVVQIKRSPSTGEIITEESYNGVYATVFADAATNQCYAFKRIENAYAFVEGTWDMARLNDFDAAKTARASHSPQDRAGQPIGQENEIAISHGGGTAGMTDEQVLSTIESIQQKLETVRRYLLEMQQQGGAKSEK